MATIHLHGEQSSNCGTRTCTDHDKLTLQNRTQYISLKNVLLPSFAFREGNNRDSNRAHLATLAKKPHVISNPKT